MSDPSNSKRTELLFRMLPKTETGTPRVGDYELGDTLGAGGMGIVFKGRRIGGDTTDLAIKILPIDLGPGGEDFVKRFDREAKLAQSIDHDNVVHVLDSGKEGMVLYLVMEFCDGGSVRDQIEENGTLTVGTAVDVIIQAAHGLGAAHDAGIIHRDIKPDNIFFMKSTKLYKVGDLGLAKNITSSNTTSLTKTNMAFGTPPYMSPEQIANAKSVDQRTDIYALGASLFEMLTGCTPYLGSSAMQIMRDVLQKPVPDPRQLKPNLDSRVVSTIKRMLSKDPNDRPQTCSDLIDMLSPIITRGTRMRTFAFGNVVKPKSAESVATMETEAVIRPDPDAIPQTILDPRYTMAHFEARGAPLTMNQPLPTPILPKMQTPDELDDMREPPEIIVNSLGTPFLRIEVYDDGGPSCGGEFYISKYPITWGEFDVYDERHSLQQAKYHNDRHPVTFVDWEAVLAFSRYMTERDRAAGILPDGLIYRPPTENEWMRAAGWNLHTKKMHVWPWSDVWNSEYCNAAESRLDRTRVVGRYIKGISAEWCHDMAGNVFEWCYPNTDDKRDDGFVVLKGGGFRSSKEECMVAARQWADPSLKEPDIGIRLVRAAPLS